jgi:drug/metabolite transporter (DMT)-like permease
MTGLVLFLVADACGAIPTIRGVLRDADGEIIRGWALLAAAGAAAVLAVEPGQWGWSTTGFGHWGGAVYVGLVNSLVTGSIVLARAMRPTAVAVP